MVEHAEIVGFARELARTFEPDRIILFGSYAYGEPRPDSEVDAEKRAEPDWGDLRDDLQELSVFAVATRYPGESAGEPEASRAVRLGSKVRNRVRTRLGID